MLSSIRKPSIDRLSNRVAIDLRVLGLGWLYHTPSYLHHACFWRSEPMQMQGLRILPTFEDGQPCPAPTTGAARRAFGTRAPIPWVAGNPTAAEADTTTEASS